MFYDDQFHFVLRFLFYLPLSVSQLERSRLGYPVVHLLPGGMVSDYLMFRFLDASSHLYKRVCASVGPSVRCSVGPYVFLL